MSLTTEHDGQTYNATIDGDRIAIYRGAGGGLTPALHMADRGQRVLVGTGSIRDGRIECDAEIPDAVYEALEQQMIVAERLPGEDEEEAERLGLEPCWHLRVGAEIVWSGQAADEADARRKYAGQPI